MTKNSISAQRIVRENHLKLLLELPVYYHYLLKPSIRGHLNAHSRDKQCEYTKKIKFNAQIRKKRGTYSC